MPKRAIWLKQNVQTTTAPVAIADTRGVRKPGNFLNKIYVSVKFLEK
jgi:hypothetical protein